MRITIAHWNDSDLNYAIEENKITVSRDYARPS